MGASDRQRVMASGLAGGIGLSGGGCGALGAAISLLNLRAIQEGNEKVEYKSPKNPEAIDRLIPSTPNGTPAAPPVGDAQRAGQTLPTRKVKNSPQEESRTPHKESQTLPTDKLLHILYHDPSCVARRSHGINRRTTRTVRRIASHRHSHYAYRASSRTCVLSHPQPENSWAGPSRSSRMMNAYAS